MFGWRTVKSFRNLTCSILRPTIKNTASGIPKAHSLLPIIHHGSRIEMNGNLILRNVIARYAIANQFSTCAILFMPAPTQKKRKMDPMLDRAKVERKKKRISKALRKMDKKPRILRPLHELEVDPVIFGGELKDKRQRNHRALSPTELEAKTEEHALLMKDWSRFAGRRHEKEIRQVDAVLISRQKALEELRKESRELYAEALKPDTCVSILEEDKNVYYHASGPTATPPIRRSTKDDLNENWLIDGHYEEITKKYAVQYADTRAFMNSLIRSSNYKKKKKKEEE